MRLPSMRPRKVIQVLNRAGFEEARQTGSHLILVNKDRRKIVPIPVHTKDIKRGLLLSIIKQSGLTVNEFIKLL